MKKGWTYADIIDLEHIFMLDSAELEMSQEDKAKRDRDIYVDLKKEGNIYDGSQDKDLVLNWARRRIEILYKDKNPGRRALEVWKSFLYFMVFSGFVAGASCVSAALYYKGEAPVNIAIFFSVTVLPHWFFMLILGGRFIWNHFSKNEANFSLPLIYRLTSKFISSFYILTSDKDNKSLNYGMSWIVKIFKLYSSAFFWPLFIIIQVFGLSTAIGSISVALIRIAFTDLAFGWQSTFQKAQLFISEAVFFLSIPWKFFLPEGVGFPGPESIAGSRIILKDGAEGLLTHDLASWWPFLCLCIIFYAVLPRLILLLSGVWMARRQLSMLKFSHAECSHLLLRMRSPILDSSAEKNSPPLFLEKTDKEKTGVFERYSHHENTTNSVFSDRTSETYTSDESSAIRSVVVVSADFFDLAGGDSAITDSVIKLTGINVCEVLTYEPEPESEKVVISKLRSILEINSNISVVFIMESWQPPIIETIDFISLTRSISGKERNIMILLTGKPMPSNAFTHPSEIDMSIWKTFLNKLSDPYLLIMGFGAA